MTRRSAFRHFKTNPKFIRLAEMLYIRFPLSLRIVVDLLHERGIEIRHETARYWWNRFGPMFAAAITVKRVVAMRSGLVRKMWRAPTEEPEGVLWETGTDRRRSFGVKRCGLH